jgi:hypothetical protein
MLAKLYKPTLSLKEEDFGQPPAAAYQQTQSLNRTQFVVQSEGGAGRNLLLGAHIRVKCRQFFEESPAATFRR